MYGLTVMVVMVILRLGIPFAITLLLVWALKRLDAHWQRETRLAHR